MSSSLRMTSRAAETNTGPRPSQRATLFFCCAPVDRGHRTTLAAHLAGLFRERFAPWSEDDVLAGTEHEAAIARALDYATVIVLLVSADLLASTRHHDRELKRALARHERGEALVIPLILRACDWNEEPFAKLQVLPRERGAPPDRVPVLSGENTDEAFAEVAIEIRKAVEAFVPAPSAPVDDCGGERPRSAPAHWKTLVFGVAAAALVITVALALSRVLTRTPDSGALPHGPSASSTASSSATANTTVAPSSSSAATTAPSSSTRTSVLPTANAPVNTSSPSASISTSTATPLPTITAGSATCKGTLCTLAAKGGRVTASRFCLSASASAADLEDLRPTCSGTQLTAGADFTCVRLDQAASIPLKGSIAWTACP